ncbi:MAG: hypothetical protein M3Q39_10050 [Actinomycetota bacterium]|nr:hypothetical protein [Actinomycetota bacterium]
MAIKESAPTILAVVTIKASKDAEVSFHVDSELPEAEVGMLVGMLADELQAVEHPRGHNAWGAQRP